MDPEVLLVEDEKNIILGVRTCLDAVGYRAHVVEDGEEALKYLKPEARHSASGSNAAQDRWIRGVKENKERFHRISGDCLDSQVSREDQERALALGADYYMTKPFRPRELWDKIKHFLPGSEEDPF